MGKSMDMERSQIVGGGAYSVLYENGLQCSVEKVGGEDYLDVTSILFLELEILEGKTS